VLALMNGYTGARWSELAGLRAHDYDEINHAVPIRTPLLEVRGRFETAKKPKTPAGKRSIQLPPFLVAFCIAEASSTWPVLRRAGGFAVHLLAEEQADLAARFARKGVDRFAAPTSWRPGPQEVPLLDGVAASLVCRRFDTRLIGDHWLVVGEVTHTLVLEDPRPPLLYHRGAFGGFDPLT
jgi:hypothetical protein